MALFFPVLAILAGVTLPWQSFSGNYIGKHDGGTVKLRLTQAGDGSVTGSFDDGSSTATIAGSVTGGKVIGTFTYQGIAIPFEVRRKDSKIEFVMKFGTEEEAMELGRDGVAPSPTKPSPLQPAPAKPTPAKPTVVSAPPSSGERFRHPAGISLALPSGWRAQTEGLVTILLPPGMTKPNGDELYLLLVGEANGITSKQDPRLEQVAELLLNGERGEGGLLLGKGVTFQREGRDGDGLTYSGNGGKAYVRCLFSDPRGRMAGVIGLGLKSRVQPREPALQAALASLSASAPEHDPRLLGSWKGTQRTKSIDARDAGGRLKASSVSDSSTTYQLSNDGRYVQSRWSRTIALGSGVSLDTGDSVERTAGQWATINGKIALTDPHGLYFLGSYQIQNGQIVIELANQIITLTRG